MDDDASLTSAWTSVKNFFAEIPAKMPWAIADSSVAETMARQARSNSVASSRTCCSSSGEMVMIASSIAAPSASRKNSATIMIKRPKPSLATNRIVSVPSDRTGFEEARIVLRK